MLLAVLAFAGVPADARAQTATQQREAAVLQARGGHMAEAQAALKSAYRLLFREKLTISNALARIESELPSLPEVKHLIHFIKNSARGISK